MAWEVWPALCVGATLHLPPADVGNENIDELLAWWLAQPLDVSFLPTPVAEYAFSQNLEHPTLRTLLIGASTRWPAISKATRSPTFTPQRRAATSPTSSMVPTFSWPMMMGAWLGLR